MDIKIIACETLRDEIETVIQNKQIQRVYLPFGLHLNPEYLHLELQKEIDQSDSTIKTILLGYGMCSKGTIGLHARGFRLVIPKAHDCISILLGCKEEHLRQYLQEPGTFYLTKGWIECGDNPYSEYKKLCQKYSPDKAYRLEKLVIANYTRLAFISAVDQSAMDYQNYSEYVANFFGLRFEVIRGSALWLQKLINGQWDQDFVVINSGEVVDYKHFWD
jgi:hypothetical protein